MNKIIVAIVLSAVFAVAAFFVSPSYCDDKPQIKSFEGRVSYINWVTATIRVNGVGGEMEFYVPQNVSIRKLGATIWLMDVNILDNAIVRYYEDDSGGNTVVNITITVV
ncbi:MAG: hypothetical protein Q8R38_08645 [Candidatus Omnitrophota bacterium]|nr:hypothetical protein [Candidatus Omnitrophota bacterium]